MPCHDAIVLPHRLIVSRLVPIANRYLATAFGTAPPISSPPLIESSSIVIRALAPG